jgi:hypothetical protein
MINLEIRKAGASTPYKGLFIVTMNGVDQGFARPRSEAEAQKGRILSAIAEMRDAGQGDVTILGKYSALPGQQ